MNIINKWNNFRSNFNNINGFYIFIIICTLALYITLIYLYSYFSSINKFSKIIKKYIHEKYYTKIHLVHNIRQLTTHTLEHRLNTEKDVFNTMPKYFLFAVLLYLLIIISYTIVSNYPYYKLFNLIGLQSLQGITIFLIVIKAGSGYLMWYHIFFTCLSIFALPALMDFSFILEFIYSVRSYHIKQHNQNEIHEYQQLANENQLYHQLNGNQLYHQLNGNQMYQQYEMYHNHQNEMNQLQSLSNHLNNTLPVSLFDIRALIRHLVTHSNGFLWWLKHLVNNHMPKSQ